MSCVYEINKQCTAAKAARETRKIERGLKRGRGGVPVAHPPILHPCQAEPVPCLAKEDLPSQPTPGGGLQCEELLLSSSLSSMALDPGSSAPPAGPVEVKMSGWETLSPAGTAVASPLAETARRGDVNV